MGSEPQSLFLYGDSSTAARNVWEAIYDGPVDVSNFEKSGVILEQLPSIANGGVFFEPVQVQAGSIVVDAEGNMTNLNEGVVYLPSGCSSKACALTYSGQEPVQVDQLVVRFRMQPLIPNIPTRSRGTCSLMRVPKSSPILNLTQPWI